MRSVVLSLTGAFTAVFVADTARADDRSDAARAAAVLFDEGRRLMMTEDYAAGCQKLAESQALDPSPDTAMGLGICYEKASQAAFGAARELARPSEQARATSTISRAPASVVEGATPGKSQRVVGMTIGGAGTLGIVTSLVTGLMAKAAYDRSTSTRGASSTQEYESAATLGTASSISLLAGAAAVATGAIVFFTAPSATPAAATTTVGLAPTVGGAFIAFSGRL